MNVSRILPYAIKTNNFLNRKQDSIPFSASKREMDVFVSKKGIVKVDGAKAQKTNEEVKKAQEDFYKLGYNSYVDSDNKIILNGYDAKQEDLKEFGIDENELFKHVKAIEGGASFIDSNIVSFPELEYVNGEVYFVDCNKLNSLPALEKVSGEVYIKNSSIQEIPKLKHIGGDLTIHNCPKLAVIPNLEEIKGSAYLDESDIKFPNLKAVEKDLYARSSNVLMDSLETVGSSLYIKKSSIETFPSLRYVGKSIDARYCEKLKSMPKLEMTGVYGGYADFSYSSIEDLSGFSVAFGGLDVSYCSKLKSLPLLESVGLGAIMKNSAIETLPKLNKVGGRLDISGCKDLTSLSALEIVDNDVDFRGSGVREIASNLRIRGEIIC